MPVTQEAYERLHENIARLVHWRIYQKYGLDRTKTWYDHEPEVIIENDNAKILWDFMIQCDHEIENKKPGIVLIGKERKLCWIIDIACPSDNKACDKEEKDMIDYYIERYDGLVWKIKQLWSMKKVVVVPIVIVEAQWPSG